MPRWSKGELARIVEADDLKIAPLREDGVTHGTPTWIWCVSVGGALYVRAYSGRKSSWYVAAMREKKGRIVAAGKARNVFFAPVAGKAINARIDDAYREKYRTSKFLKPMVGARVRAATVRITPRRARPEAAR